MADFPQKRQQGHPNSSSSNGDKNHAKKKKFSAKYEYRQESYRNVTPAHRRPAQAAPTPVSKKSRYFKSGEEGFYKVSKSKGGLGYAKSKSFKNNNLVRIVSEKPLLVKIRKYSTIPKGKSLSIQLDQGKHIETTTRSGRRIQSLKKITCNFDTDDSDENEFDDSTVQMHALNSATAMLAKKRGPSDATTITTPSKTLPQASAHIIPVYPETVEGPPSGTLPSLWYSRECCLHIFVVEKILSWKRRHKVLKIDESIHEPPQATDTVKLTSLTFDYKNIADRLLDYYSSIGTARKRRDVSRINPSQCPTVLTTKTMDRVPKSLKDKFGPSDEMEDVLLIKWRGFSHIHCSWERPADLLKFDPTNTTAKQKIKRFYMLQEMSLGINWKGVLEEGRKTPSSSGAIDPSSTEKEEEGDEEIAFPPEYMEVDRILSCDENEMDPKLFHNQLAKNRMMQKQLLGKENSEKDDIIQHLDTRDSKSITLAKEEPWDPEDNVRYIVRWKGLQTSDSTWEYWKDLKYDFVQEASDFWDRQKAPTMEVVKKVLVRRHPQVKDFKKLQISPTFGIKRNCMKMTYTEDEDDQQNALRLRGYQLEGVNWLLWNWFNKRSCILADEMGLGKTIQSIGLLDQLSKFEVTKIRGPFLIVAPLSLISQWQSETRVWAPDLNVIVYHGSADARDFLVKQEFFYNEQFVGKGMHMKLKKTNWTKFHILITTFEVILKDISVLSKIRWRCLIVDEAHRLKNPKSRLFIELSSVPRDFCLLLTGTPLQNSTEELWALLSFADPVGFASRETFVEKFGQLTDSKQVSALHGILKPYLLRRVKEDVEKSLPPKEETILEVTLTPIQKTYYKAIYERNTSFLFKGSKPSNAPSLMNIMMELRKCCNHPFLIRGVEERIIADASKSKKGEKENEDDGEINPITPTSMYELMAENLITSSGKMVLLSKLLPKLKDGGHKVLIFSQMVRVLDLLEDLLRYKKYRYERLDGSTSASLRTAAVDRFCRRSYQRFVMLLSTRAGGLGLNLTAADTVIIFDSDWNPQNDLQAMARAHRIGQTRAVRVYRLLTAKTYEMHMFHSASLKLGLDRAVLAHQRHNDTQNGEVSARKKYKKEKEIQAKEIDQLLKKGAYDVFRDEDDDKESKKFMETDIDSLLATSSRKVTYGKTAETNISSGLGSFSKASFVANAGDDIDLDDPDFWKKAVGFEAPIEGKEDGGDSLQGKKRSRKQVQVFDPYAAFAEAEQRKQDKIIAKAKEEKEERERLRKANKLKKQEEKDRRKRERLEAKEAKGKLIFLNADNKRQRLEEDRLLAKETGFGKDKKMKKSERDRRLRQILNEDPLLERLKQGWQSPQRNRAINAALDFGLDRLCKCRQESYLTSLPIQDLEVFLRGYLFQVGLQAGVSYIEKGKQLNLTNEFDMKNTSTIMVKDLLNKYGEIDGRWVCKAMNSALRLHEDIRSRKRSLRLPFSLNEKSFVQKLRNGAAINALRRLSFLSRLTKIISAAIDCILVDLGHEELGKRGCATKDLSTLDVDMKARHVTTEELTHALGANLDAHFHDGINSPCFSSLSPWWDRSCDVALIIGSFIHGLGNYKSMQVDEDLPFGFKISQHAVVDKFSFQAYQNFDSAAKAVHKLYKKSIDKSTNTNKTSQDVSSSGKTKIKAEGGYNNALSPYDKNPNDNEAIATIVNMVDLSTIIVAKIRSNSQLFKSAVEKAQKEKAMQKIKCKTVTKISKTGASENSFMLPWNQRLPMPDSLTLDQHLAWLIDNIEKKKQPCADQMKSLTKIKSLSMSGIEEKKSGLNQLSNDLLFFSLEKMHGESIIKSPSNKNFYSFNYGRKYGALLEDSPCLSEAIIVDIGAVMGGLNSTFEKDYGIPNVLTKYGLSGLVFADKPVISSLRNELDDTENKHIKKEPDIATSHDLQAGLLPSSPNEGYLRSFKDLMSSWFQQKSEDRAKICIALFENGSPIFQQEKSFFKVNTSVWSAVFGDDDFDDDEMPERKFYDISSLAKHASLSIEIEDTDNLKMIEYYINSVLLPYCLLLCLEGSGTYESSDNTDHTKCHLPDPFLSLHDHSKDSIKIASSILRRTRLMKAIRYIIGGGVPGPLLLSYLKSNAIRQNLLGLPIWWCPWIHDLALLIYVATYGLFSIVLDKANEKERFTEHAVFGTEALETHIRTIFLEGKDGLKPALPQCFLNKISLEEKEAWLQKQASHFPSAHVIERRLAFIASELTTTAAGMNAQNKTAEWRFDNFPMFDHDNLKSIMNNIDRSGFSKLGKSLLCEIEDEANAEMTREVGDANNDGMPHS